MAARQKKKESLDEVLKRLEKAMESLHNSDFKGALKLLTAIASSEIDRPEIIEKARQLQLFCERKLDPGDGKPSFTSPEVIYNYGVFCHNRGDFEEAAKHFKNSLKAAGKKLDYVYYAMAASLAAQGQKNEALSSLRQAITLNETLRVQAANDPDFSHLSEDEDFRGLLVD